MRDDDDHLRQYTPLVQRIILLVAVLTAIPVILWAVTGFVSSYVGPTRAPNYRATATTAPLQIVPTQDVASTGSGQQDAAQPSPRSDALPAMSEARAATAYSPSSAAPANASALGDRMASAPNAAAAPSLAAMPATTPMAPAVVQPAMPAAVAAALAAPSEQQPAASEQAADDVPAAEPIKGPIPLPRHRPRHVAMAEPAAPSAGTPAEGQVASPKRPPKAAVPMPRARPEEAGPAVATDTTTPGPLDFIQNLFQQH